MRQGVLPFFSQAHDGVHASFRMIVARKEKEMKGTAMLLHFLLSSDAHFLHCIEA